MIPLDATLVRGSHGGVPEDPDDWPVFVQRGTGGSETPLTPEGVHGLLLAAAAATQRTRETSG